MLSRRVFVVFVAGLMLGGLPHLRASTAFPRSIVPVEDASAAQTVGTTKTYGRIVRSALTDSELATTMHFDVALKLRNKDELDARLARSEVLSATALEAYLPTADEYARIRSWLVAQGFKITLDSTTRHAIFAEGPSERVAAVFGVRLARVTTADGEFTSAVSEPSLPDEIAGAVAGIRGLQPHLIRHPRSPRKPEQLETNDYYAITPAALAAAYQAPGNLTGSGQTIAVIGDSVVNTSDVAGFWSECGISQSLTNFIVVNVGGGPGTHKDDQFEVSMDVEWTSGLAPGAQVRLYSTTYPLDSDSEAAAYTQILNDLSANPNLHQVSESFGGAESPFELSEGDTALPLLAAQGVTCFAASGDGGSNPDTNPSVNTYNSSSPVSVGYPAADPYMTAVGGTTLIFPKSLNGQASFPEVAWSVSGTGSNGTGGGFSAEVSRPSWQVAPGVPTGSMRCIPDVSALADTGGDMGAFVYQGGKAYGGGGTSLSSPIWTAICALINQARANAGQGPVGYLNPLLYQAANSSCYTDITSGSNGAYQAGTGYDLCTGLGTPLIGNLVTFLTTTETAPSITTQPVSQAVFAGFPVTLTAAASGSPTPTFQWQKNGTNIGGATNSSYSIAAADLGDAGSYNVIATNPVGSISSNVAMLTVTVGVAPSFTLYPVSQTAYTGYPVTLTASASGTPTPTFQWQKDGANISGATSSSYLIASAALSDAGSYSVTATNQLGSDSSGTATLTIVTTVAPAFTTQPAGQTVGEGDSFTLTVVASGAPAPTYQWRKNGTNISGATNNIFAIAGVSLGDAGNYDVVASNGGGSATSTVAVITVVHLAPVITGLSPTRQVIMPGQSMNLSVTATGSGSLTYQWSHNGRPIGGANSSTWSVSAVSFHDAGYYLVDVTDNVGTRRSAPIFVSVSPPNAVVVLWGNTTDWGTVGSVPADLGNVVGLSAYGFPSLALDSNGTVAPWYPYVLSGRFGIGTPPSVVIEPVSFPTGLSNVVAVASGGAHSLALKADGTVAAWGNNDFGQASVPADLADVVAIAAGSNHSLALKADGTVVGWGSNDNGEITTPAGLANVVGIAAGYEYSMALKADGTVVAWGYDSVGQSDVPAGLTDVAAISVGEQLSLALKADGTVVSWGNLSSGSVPSGLSGVVAVSAGLGSALALKADGTVVAWNDNTTDASYSAATVPAGLSNVFAIAAGQYYWLALCDPAPAVSAQPLGEVTRTGQNFVLSVSVGGVGPFTYQWFKNGVAISGATGATLDLTNLHVSDGGVYTVVVSNAYGSVTSSGATLTVRPPVADFNGDGQSDLLWQDTLTGDRLVWLMNGTAAFNAIDVATLPTDWSIAATGDFNGDGQTDLVWQNTGTGERVIWLMNGTTPFNAISLGTVSTDWLIVGAGDLNGDGQPDILWTNTVTGERLVWLMNGATAFNAISLGIVPFQWSLAGTGDFNGDGQTDLLWDNTLTGQIEVWLMNGTTQSSVVSIGTVSPQLQIAGTGDFNADDRPDIVFTNRFTGERSVWLMNGTTRTSTVSLTTIPLNWVLFHPVARRVWADFNSDGKSDLIWQNTTSGEVLLYLMDGTTPFTAVSIGTADPNLQIAATGDFNSDGKADLVWQNLATGDRFIWLMNDTTMASSVDLGVVSTDWSIIGTGDFNADGYSDLIWKNKITGEYLVWLMNGTTPFNAISLGVINPNLELVGTGDFNSDSNTDLLWQNATTGERLVWLMNGTTMASSVSLGTISTDWSLSGTGDFNADGQTDLIWVNTVTGERVIWLMNGTVPFNGVSLGIYPLDWAIKN